MQNQEVSNVVLICMLRSTTFFVNVSFLLQCGNAAQPTYIRISKEFSIS